MMNIPIYKAKKIDIDQVEEYAIGQLVKHNGKHFIIQDEYVFDLDTEIDPSTLAISQNGIDWFSIDKFNSILNASQKNKRKSCKGE